MKSFESAVAQVLSVLCTMLIGMVILVAAQAMGLVPFGIDMSRSWIGLWFQPGITYLAWVIALGTSAVGYSSLANFMAKEMEVPRSKPIAVKD